MISIWRAFPSGVPRDSGLFVIFANILNEDKSFTVASTMEQLAQFLFQPLPLMQTLGSPKLHFLDFLTAWILDMNCMLSSQCILARFGGWKWNRSYPPTHFWWFSWKQAHSSSNVLESILEILRDLGSTSQCQVSSSMNIKIQSSGGSDGSSSSISSFLVWLPDPWSGLRYELVPQMINSTVLFWLSFLEAQSKACSSMLCRSTKFPALSIFLLKIPRVNISYT